MTTIKTMIRIIKLAGQFTMVSGLHGISVRVDGDTIHVDPFVQDPHWDGWRNFESPSIRITSDGKVFSIHEDEDGNGDWWELLTERSHPNSYVSVNRHDWGINYFKEDANAVKAYILNLAAMWAAYNDK